MKWESSPEYYRIINEKVKKEPGDLNVTKSILYTVEITINT